MQKKIVIFCLLLLSTALLSAQSLITSEYNYKHYTIPDGLPTNLVETVFQDSRGFMWFGTEHGFVCFDGHTIKKYMPNKSLPINKIEESERGEIVIYGYHFIYVLDVNSDKLRFTIVSIPQKSIKKWTTSTLADYTALLVLRQKSIMVLFINKLYKK